MALRGHVAREETTMTKLRPYVGVAGFMSSAEIMAAIETLPQNPTHSLAIGILASAKTIVGQTNKYPTRYPRIVDLGQIVGPAQRIARMNDMPVEFILHFAVDDEDSFHIQMERAVDVVEDCEFDGIQINASPHVITKLPLWIALDAVKMATPRMKRVIMQLRPPRDNEPRLDLIGAGIRLANSDVATDILIDASAGAGIPLNVTTASIMIAGIRAAMADRYSVGIGVAGGLTASTLGGVGGLMEVHGPLSFDVESGVRDDQDHMDVAELRSYLRHAWTRTGSR